MNPLAGLRVENFTAFAALDLSFSPGITVVIGTNATGKTHLLKILYAACAITTGEDRDKGFALKLRNVFMPYEGDLGRLVRRPVGVAPARVSVTRRDGSALALAFSSDTHRPDRARGEGQEAWEQAPVESAFLPVKEILAHAPGFLATVARREMAFEEIYADILARALLPVLKGPLDEATQAIVDGLERLLGGQVVEQDQTFFLQGPEGALEFALVAEGARKLGLVLRLLRNGCVAPGSVLFWDEPESNLNPGLVGEVAEVILALQRLGVQIFLATHNYVLLKELDLRRTDTDRLGYVSLFRGASGAVEASASESYDALAPNAIAEAFDALVDRSIRRSLAGSG
ncbi:AAA family ATPase [Pararhodospirillum oryzae]|uniref:AAA+ ATPase domain-containing protein n=1 Tax=Pararhodospirillum oryzae TaxID=478448 RepID=A0A512H9K6_9PROT|nr:ATP-binding protein [Pararhodospirillum oryzae]GEO82144.1 hypothetical protein ROR02_22750 [Pararhodospirillum oryzae]